MASSSGAIREAPLRGGVCLPGERVLRAEGDATLVIGRGLTHVQQLDRQRNRPQPGASTADEDVADIVASVGGRVARDSINVDAPAASSSSADVVPTAAPRYRVVSDGAKRYVPQLGDGVVGVVLRVSPHAYSVHIGAAAVASLEALAFDGASKTNRPKLAVGDLVYARVAEAEADAEVELSCCATGDMPRKDWGTGEAIFGPLPLGATAASVVVSLTHADGLLQNRNTALLVAGTRLGFEAVIGVNGRVWVRVPPGIPRKALVALTRIVIESADCVTPDEAQALVDKYFPPPATAAPGGADVATAGAGPIIGGGGGGSAAVTLGAL
uniref:Ribosomal RNA-processing protein 40 n=1 Tax=Neobodo designis TaxID=312471 RepID=A0A7S1QQG0_NEODS